MLQYIISYYVSYLRLIYIIQYNIIWQYVTWSKLCAPGFSTLNSRHRSRDVCNAWHPATPCGGEVWHGATSGASRGRRANKRQRRWGCDMVLHRVFPARHLWTWNVTPHLHREQRGPRVRDSPLSVRARIKNPSQGVKQAALRSLRGRTSRLADVVDLKRAAHISLSLSPYMYIYIYTYVYIYIYT